MRSPIPIRSKFLVAGTLATLANLAACKGSTATPPDGAPSSFDKTALLEGLASCAAAQALDFEQTSALLRDATAAYAAARSDANATAARAAWQVAMASWEHAELFQFGPAAPSDQPGGQDLRDQIYSWPLVSPCRIDEQTISQIYAAPGFGDSLTNGRGLAALEYLLFDTGTDNACASFSPINSEGTWAALAADADALRARRAAYAAAAAVDVHARATALVAAWQPGTGSFRDELARAGLGSATFTSAQAGLNVVSDALFYLDKLVKDTKVARPAGLMDCETPTCPEALEARLSQLSAAHVVANLEGFERLYAGCGAAPGTEPLGFDDWLRAVGANDLAERMTAAIADAHALAVTLGPSLEPLLASELARVLELHVKLKVITDALKTELVSVLDLELPKSVESDND